VGSQDHNQPPSLCSTEQTSQMKGTERDRNSLIGKEKHLQRNLDRNNSEENFKPSHESNYPFKSFNFI
jgi:hypothetical protein